MQFLPVLNLQARQKKIIGNWLKTKSRDDVMIASKVAGRSNMDFLRESHSETRLNKEQITAALEGSLKRLDTDYIDVYYLHWPDRKIGLFADSFGYDIKKIQVPYRLKKHLAFLMGFKSWKNKTYCCFKRNALGRYEIS